MRTFIAVTLLTLVACTAEESSIHLDAQAAASLDAVLAAAVADGSVPGVVGLDRDGVLYQSAFGVMDASGDKPMRLDAIFPIASMTKPITTVGIMMLLDEGALGLDDPASKYLPDMVDREVLVSIDSATSEVVTRPASRPVTVRDLLRHTSGFGYTFDSPELLEWTQVTGRSSLEQPLLHDPGERWTYGTSTAFLGRIIEEVSGASLPEFLEQRILSPLGMGDTSYDLAEGSADRLVALYRRSNGTLQGQAPARPYRAQMVRGDGGLLSTAEDYGRFIRLILGGGATAGTRLLSPESIALMATDQLEGVTVVEQPGAIPALSSPFPLGAGSDGFSFGFQVAKGQTAGRAPGSLSWAGLQNTHFWIDPETGIGVVLMAQLLPFYDEAVIQMLTDFERTLYQHIE